MFKKGNIIELEIEKLVFEGYGLARKKIDNNDFVFFVENVCDGDVISAEITKVKKNYAYAKMKEIIKPSKYRVEPFCPLHNACGGCQWGFISYPHQLEVKQNIVKEILSNALGEDIKVEKTLPSPKIKEFRHKIQMPVSQTKNSKRFLIGYYKKQSHEIVNIKYCPIQPRIIDEITDKIRCAAFEYGVEAYNEIKHKGELRHVVYRISTCNDVLVCFVVNNNEISKSMHDLAHYIFNEFENVKGISVNFNTSKNNVILGEKTQNIFGDKTYKEKIGEITYIISPDSFFQVNPDSFKNILDKVKELISCRIKTPEILDAYSGVGSFGLYLSGIAKNIVCAEIVKSACQNARQACEINNINNVEIIEGDSQNIFGDLIKNKRTFDVVILDPPRKGCTKETLDFCAKLSKKYIVYVSCNPNTLARDLKYLKEFGFKIEYAQTADMFCHTYHVETITILSLD